MTPATSFAATVLLVCLANPILAFSHFQQEVVQTRQLKQAGVTVGGGLIAAAFGAGVVGGILDPFVVDIASTAGLCAALLYTKTFDEEAEPLADHYFQIQPSQIPGAGQGLFATKNIPADTFLFCYGGDILDEDEYFERYPNREDQGGYVAFVEGAPW